MNKKIIISVLVVILIILAILVYFITKKGANSNEKQNVQENAQAEQKEENKEEKSMYSSGKHHAQIVIKNYGTISLELDADMAPITVENFANLVNEGFYDGLTFHRIISGFMIQGGDPLGNGTGGSDEEIKGEFALNGVENSISHTRGTISMARASAYNSASSQFFIMHQDYTGLDGAYAAFGKVTEGMEFVDKICEDVVPVDNNGTVLKSKQPVIVSIKMID